VVRQIFLFLPGIGGKEGRAASAAIAPITWRDIMSVASVGYSPVSPAPVPVGIRPDAAVSEPKLVVSEPKKVKAHVISSTASDLERLVFNRKLQFVVDHNSHEVIVKVIDKDTDKVIKVLPPEELQRLHNNLKEHIGFLFDERV
jgi:flagellar protein FlaG